MNPLRRGSSFQPITSLSVRERGNPPSGSPAYLQTPQVPAKVETAATQQAGAALSMELLIFILLLALVFGAVWMAIHGQVIEAFFLVLLLLVVIAVLGAPDLDVRHR